MQSISLTEWLDTRIQVMSRVYEAPDRQIHTIMISVARLEQVHRKCPCPGYPRLGMTSDFSNRFVIRQGNAET